MSLHFLSQFESFDFARFCAGKRFQLLRTLPWVDYSTKAPLGTKAEVVIISDDTPYQQKEGQQLSNEFEKLTFKVSKQVDYPPRTEVVPVDATAIIYGDYRNLLSIKCADLRVVQPASAKQNGTGNG